MQLGGSTGAVQVAADRRDQPHARGLPDLERDTLPHATGRTRQGDTEGPSGSFEMRQLFVHKNTVLPLKSKLHAPEPAA